MKKYVTLLAAGIITLGVAACGGSDNDSTPPVTEPDPVTEPVDDAVDDVADEPVDDPADPVITEEQRNELSMMHDGLLIEDGFVADMMKPADGDETMLTVTGSWIGVMVTTDEDRVNLYTDEGEPESVEFDDLFMSDDDYNAQDRIVLAPGLNAHQGLIAADGFQTGAGTRTHGDPDMETETVTVIGTFAGATGSFECVKTADTACTSSGTNDGVMLSSAWVFNVDADQMARVPDMEYSHFGWWIVETDDGYDVDAYYGSMADGMGEPSTPLTGSASFAGAAAGLAVVRSQLPNGPIDGGAFMAAVTLTADFEDGTIMGAVDDFTIDGDDRDWSVMLDGTVAFMDADGTDFMGDTEWSIG